jgi:hypothetical protein
MGMRNEAPWGVEQGMAGGVRGACRCRRARHGRQRQGSMSVSGEHFVVRQKTEARQGARGADSITRARGTDADAEGGAGMSSAVSNTSSRPRAFHHPVCLRPRQGRAPEGLTR